MAEFKLEEILFYIDENIQRRITLPELADIAGYSPFYFSRIFSEKVGIPITGYIRIRKMQYALASLTKGKKVVDVAFSYAFESQEGFTRAFKQLFGTSPGQVRRYLDSYQVPDYMVLIRAADMAGARQEENMIQRDLEQIIFTVLQESLEEMEQGFCTCITLHFMEDGAVVIADNGRGIQLSGNQSADRKILDKILAGRPITALEYSQLGDFQQMNLQTVNSLCESLHVDIYRDGRHFWQDYIRGIAQHEMMVEKSEMESGMMMTLKPDTEIFGSLIFSMEYIVDWIGEKAEKRNIFCEEKYIRITA